MALYEYQCDACGHRFEIIQKWSDPPQETCPKCGGTVHKLQSAPAFQFKGTGWYVTDYAKKDQGGSAKSSGDSTADNKASSERSEKSEKSDKGEKSDKADKSEKSEKSEKAADSSKGGSSGDATSGTTSSKSS
ncbi:MAG: FmdB family zinc ribbon protein [Acidobacteriota bacterium]